VFQQNLHTHSIFDDGQNTLEEMTLAAKKAGLTSIGFSVHTPMPFEDGWGWTISKERLPEYKAEVRRLNEQYRGVIDVYCGAEWETLSDKEFSGYEYVIGSMHHILWEGEAYSVDAAAEHSARYLERVFHGDTETAAEAYFQQYEALAAVEEVDIVGHFDLLTKFNEQARLYNPESARFQKAAEHAMDALIAKGKIFEINTGAISRGYRTTPYPSKTLLEKLHARGARITISADAHRTQDVAFGFAEAEALARACGYREAWRFDGTDFVAVSLGEE